jgi:competence protein ComEC
VRTAILAFVTGVVWLQCQPQLPELHAVYLLLASAALLLLLLVGSGRLARPNVNIPLLFVAGLTLGFGWAALLAHAHLAESLPPQWEGRDLRIIGTVASLPDYFSQGVRFNFRIEQAMSPEDGASVALPPNIALSWYAPADIDDQGPLATIAPGERWQLTVRLRRPHGNANPYGFDYEVWLLEQNLRATGYVRADARNERRAGFVPSFGNAVERSRSWLRARILAALPEHAYAGVIVALVVGDQKTVSQADWQIFNRTGIGHLISISGLHITMIAGLAAALVSALWRRSFFTNSFLPLWLPAQKAAALAGVLTALLYVLLAGFGVPAQRTLYMVSVVAVALWCGRLTSISHVLCIALGVVLLLDPWAVLWPGFWLSFGAVAVILFASVGRTATRLAADLPLRQRWLRSLKSAAHLQYVITIGLVPLSLLLFGQLSLVSPLANALAIPLISLLVTPLALLGSVLPMPLATVVLGAAHGLVAALAAVLGAMSAWPAAVWSAPLPSWPAFACALAGIAWLLAPRGWPQRWLGLLAMLPLALQVPAHPAEGELAVTAFDVGQGMALLLETAHHRLLYDTGPVYSPESDGANRVLLPYLKARGITGVDGLVISHNDNDHSGGALSAMRDLRIGWVASSLAAASAIVQAAPGHRRCIAGQSWVWDGVRFEMLQPSAASYEDGRLKPNARSCTLKITQGAWSILLAGDIEAAQEAQLVERYGAQLKSTVLLAPHHGSGTSSTLPFLQAVQPQLALFQVGYRNRYHHPKPQVFDRYGQLGIARLRTDIDGAISLKFGKSFEASAYRTSFARYWHAQ